MNNNEVIITKYGAMTKEWRTETKYIWVTHVNGARRNHKTKRQAMEYLRTMRES
jgi:hypothetical protein